MLPAGITALSRLTELMLGQILGKRPLNARVLGDLSRFPLCKLSFNSCEVMLSRSVLGAARHASLASLSFYNAHPTPKCAPAVLQLSQEFWRLGWGSVLGCVCDLPYPRDELPDAQGRTPSQEFMAELDVCKVKACGL